nr:retrovirus-related Pol polyprotein from transposon TNT 1-94 [Tanacetum cinerariifolium]
MRIEQYFLMTDYSLWEVILNGDSPVPTRVIEGVVQPVAPTTAKQRLARKNEFKAREVINLKFLRSLPTEWRTHTLIWRNKIDLEEQSSDDLFNIIKIYEAEVKSSSSASTSTQNIAFVSSQNTGSPNKPVSVVASVFAASAKIPVSALPNVDTLSNALKLEKFQTSSKNLSQLLAGQTNDKTRLGYNNQVFTSSMFDCDEMFSSETNESLPASPIYDRPSVKPVKNSIPAANPKTDIPKPQANGNSRNRKACFVLLTKSNLVTLTAARPVTTTVPQPHVTRPRPAKTVVTKSHSPPRRNINRRLSTKPSNFPPKVNTVKVPQGNPQHALKDKGVIDSGCSRHMTRNMSYLSDFEEINSGYVAFGGNPKGGIKREFSVPRTPQQNRIAKRKNRTLIEAARTMLADLLLPIPFWTEAVNNACYVQNRVLVTKPHNKTPYALLLGRTPSIGFMRPFGCLVTILNTLDPLSKFDGKADEGSLVGYSVSSKAFRVFNSRTRIIQETLHINFLENKPNVTGSGPIWLFDIDTLTKTMNYQPLTAENQSNPSAGVQEQFDAEKAGEENVQQYVLFPVWSFGSKNPQNTDDAAFEVNEPEFKGKKPKSEVHVSPSRYRNLSAKFEIFYDNSINEVNAASTPVPAVGQISANITNTFSAAGPSNTTVKLEDITYFDDEEDVGAAADFTNLETTITVSPIPTTRVYKDHHVTQIIGDLSSATQTRSMTRVAKDQVSRIEAIRLFLAYASFMGFMVYQMDVKSVFLYGTIEEEVYVCQPPGFEDPGYLRFTKWSRHFMVYIKLLDLVKQKPDGIFISQDKYVAEILRKFSLTDGKSASNPIDTKKPLLKDPDVKRIFRYLKGKPHLGLWYPKDSPINLVAYSDSDYAGASLDRKSTTGGCQFLGCRLISWQCKKQTVVATSSTEAEKKVLTTEETIREALHLDDAESIDCLPNKEIFTELSRMGVVVKIVPPKSIGVAESCCENGHL